MYNFLILSGIFLWIFLSSIFISKVFITKEWVLKKYINYFFGSGLVDSTNKLVSEVKSQSLTDDTVGDFTGQFLMRLTRIGIYAIVIALLPMSLLFWQNRLISNQNRLISTQTSLDSTNMDLLTTQNRLIESDRRSSLIMLMSDIMNQVSIELNQDPSRKLSDPTIARIVGLSHSFKPYWHKHYSQDTFQFYSPERGQLLQNIALAEINNETSNQIYAKGNFEYSDLENAMLRNTYLRGINLSHSNLKKCDFEFTDLEKGSFRNCIIDSTIFRRCPLRESSFDSRIHYSSFYDSDLTNSRFKSSKITMSNFDGALLEGAYLYNSTIYNCDFIDTDLTAARIAICGTLSKDEYVLDGMPNIGIICTSTFNNNLRTASYIIDLDSVYTESRSTFQSSRYAKDSMKMVEIDSLRVLFVKK